MLAAEAARRTWLAAAGVEQQGHRRASRLPSGHRCAPALLQWRPMHELFRIRTWATLHGQKTFQKLIEPRSKNAHCRKLDSSSAKRYFSGPLNRTFAHADLNLIFLLAHLNCAERSKSGGLHVTIFPSQKVILDARRRGFKSRPRGAVGQVASSDPLTDAGGGSNLRWSTGKAQA